MRQSFIGVFENVPIGMGQVGLTKLALKYKKNVERMPDNTWLVFLNGKANKMKLLAPGGELLVYYRTKNERRITMEALATLPHVLGNSDPWNLSTDITRALDRLLVHGSTRPKLALAA